MQEAISPRDAWAHHFYVGVADNPGGSLGPPFAFFVLNSSISGIAFQANRCSGKFGLWLAGGGKYDSAYQPNRKRVEAIPRIDASHDQFADRPRCFANPLRDVLLRSIGQPCIAGDGFRAHSPT